jgi:hypothetical protein
MAKNAKFKSALTTLDMSMEVEGQDVKNPLG